MSGKSFIFLLVAAVLILNSEITAQTDERPSPLFLQVDQALPSVIVSLKYATNENLTGKPIYPSSRAWAHRDTITALKRVVIKLREHGYRLVIWDAYRPPWAQWKLWNAYPNPAFLADPREFSRHSRGTSVDVSLADRDGNEVEMATGHDVFTARADHDLEDLEPEIRDRVHLLRTVMFSSGFRGVPAEWWHYDLARWPDYPVVGTQEEPGAGGP
ncbi:MAG: D-alanyl-D-alanine dipeptidase [Candidatus Methylacidiphilales bacterium]